MKKEENSVKKIQIKFNEINSSLKKLDDKQFKELMGTKFFDDFLLSILNPKISSKYDNLQEFFLENKNKLSLMARLRHVITENYSFRGKVNDLPVFVSPFHSQWMDSGVIFLQGKEKFSGLIGFYDSNKDLYFAKSKRNFNAGDNVDLKKDLFFDFFIRKLTMIKT